MRITRYFQSCLLVEENGVRVLIDPSGNEAGNLDKFGKLDAVLYTHEHADHFDAELAQTFVEQGIAPLYANASTAKLIKASKTEVNDGQGFEVRGLKIKALELAHCLMIDGSEGPQNTGYMINDRFFHAGDGKELAGLAAEILAVPIAGPDISFKDASDFAKQASAKTVIPIHYDFIGTNPEVFATFAGFFKQPFKIQVISPGQSAEV